MQLTLSAPNNADPRWAPIPLKERLRVDQWILAIDRVGIFKPLSKCSAAIAAMLPGKVAAKTVRNKLEALEAAKGDWFVLVDKRVLDASATNPRNSVANTDFQTHLKTLMENNKNASRPAFEALKLAWRMQEPIPGYDGHPGWPQLPKGWSETNLYRLQPTRDILIAARQGLQAAAKHLPQVRTTRANLYPGAIYYFDDVWHDSYVRVGLKAVTRVLELGVMDAFSASRFHLGAKPRMPKEDGSGNMGIKKREMLWFLVEVLTRFGWSDRGTELRAEHGTAAISETTEAILKRITGGLVTVQRSGIIGVEQAIMGDFWRGRGKGNPRAKAPLESFHHLLHNTLADMPGQTGANRQTAPEGVGIPTLGLSDEPAAIARRIQSFLKSGHKLPLVPYQQLLLEAASIMTPEVAALIIHPLPEFFSQFYPAVQGLNHLINCRTNHSLEGWPELGFKTVEYFDPEAGQWLLPDGLKLLPPDRLGRVSACARANPTTFTRPRTLSPHDVWQTRSGMNRLSPFDAIEILGEELAEERKVNGSYFSFTDGDISPTPLFYKAEIIQRDGTPRTLHHGEKHLTLCNPYNPEFLTIVDAKMRPLGLAPRDHKVDQGNKEELARAYAEKTHRTAVRLQDYRTRHEGEAEAVGALKDNNVRVMVHGTPEEQAAARSVAAQQAVKTAAANRLHKRGNERDWNAEPAAAAPTAPAPIDPLAGLED